MGIHDIHKILKKEVPEAFRHVPVRLFRGRRLAIDGPLWAYENFSVCYCEWLSRIHDFETLLNIAPPNRREDAKKEVKEGECKENAKQEDTTQQESDVGGVEKKSGVGFPKSSILVESFLSRATDFVSQLFSHGITPIFVFDGASLRDKVEHARKRRQQARLSTQRRIDSLKQRIEMTDVLFRTSNDLVSLRKLLCQQVPLTPDTMASLQIFLSSRLGVPVVSAPDEAEKFCSFLASSGVAAAVWTTDTDAYVFGAPLVVHGMAEIEVKSSSNVSHTSEKQEEKNFYSYPSSSSVVCFPTVVVPMILQKLGLTRAQFADFCIMLGCDFNERMPNVRVGPQKCWSMVKECLSKRDCSGEEEAIKKTSDEERDIFGILEKTHPELPWKVLNADSCRKIFMDFSSAQKVSEELRLSHCRIAKERLAEPKALFCHNEGMISPRNVEFVA